MSHLTRLLIEPANTICESCHHAPSGRFDIYGLQCHCVCHDMADASRKLVKAATIALLVLLGEVVDEVEPNAPAGVAANELAAALFAATGSTVEQIVADYKRGS